MLLRRAGRADAQCYMNRAVYGIEALYHKTEVAPLKSDKTMRRTYRQHQEFLKTVERSVLEKKGGIEKKVQTLKIAQDAS